MKYHTIDTPGKKIMKENTQNLAIRYIVNDVDSSVNFYRDALGFTVEFDSKKGFAILTLGNLRLYVNQPGAGGAGQPMPDGEMPAPGGWNRILVEVQDLEAEIQRLKGMDAKFRNEIVGGIGGKQTLLQDPSGNLIELFEPKKQ
jgi:catechol 2,3-dioxygenase-like lactoylglutathione lyase family enzyme